VNVAEVILVFAGAPLAVILLLAVLIWGPGGRKRPRYRPGQPWEHAPIWYEPHPEAVGHHPSRAALDGAAHVVHTTTGAPLGGARGTW
jgi:hypothetical protein